MAQPNHHPVETADHNNGTDSPDHVETPSPAAADDVPQLDGDGDDDYGQEMTTPKNGFMQYDGDDGSFGGSDSPDLAVRTRVDSPIDSVLSGPDETPSVQVSTRPAGH